MQTLSEIEIIQNDALGAVTLWAFINQFNLSTTPTRGPSLGHLMPVYALLVDPDARQEIMTRHFDGGLLTALLDNKALFVNLQSRMLSMTSTSLRSLNLAIGCDLVSYDRNIGQFFSNRKSPPEEISLGDVSEFLRGARRLGYWMAQMAPGQYLSLLKVRF